VLIYDGDCGFCTESAKAVARHWDGRARIASFQALGDGGLAAVGLTEDDTRRAAWWVDARGRRFRGHRAMGKALAAAGGWRAALGRAILVTPLAWVARPVYWLIARNRHRLPGSTDACRLDA